MKFYPSTQYDHAVIAFDGLGCQSWIGDFVGWVDHEDGMMPEPAIWAADQVVTAHSLNKDDDIAGAAHVERLCKVVRCSHGCRRV